MKIVGRPSGSDRKVSNSKANSTSTTIRSENLIKLYYFGKTEARWLVLKVRNVIFFYAFFKLNATSSIAFISVLLFSLLVIRGILNKTASSCECISFVKSGNYYIKHDFAWLDSISYRYQPRKIVRN